MSEPDQKSNGLIAGLVAGFVVFFVALIFAISQYYSFAVEGEVVRKVLALQSAELRKLRLDEDTKLSHYQWVSQKSGVVRIPVDQAIELVLRDAANPPPAPAPVAPAVAPAGAPAVAAGVAPAVAPIVPPRDAEPAKAPAAPTGTTK